MQTPASDALINFLETLDHKVSSSMKQYIASYKRRRNELAPVNQLPLEILVWILTLAIHDNRRGDSIVSKLRIFALVGSRWLHVVKTSPVLWFHASTAYMESHELVFKLSKDSDLDVTYSSHETSADFERNCLENARRIRSLSLESAPVYVHNKASGPMYATSPNSHH